MSETIKDQTERERIEKLIAIFTQKLKSHNVSIMKDVGMSTVTSACEAMIEYASSQEAEIAELKIELTSLRDIAGKMAEALAELYNEKLNEDSQRIIMLRVLELYNKNKK